MCTDPYVIPVANVEIFRGDGDTDPERIYIQSTEVEDWVCFPVADAEKVIEAIRRAASREDPSE